MNGFRAELPGRQGMDHPVGGLTLIAAAKPDRSAPDFPCENFVDFALKGVKEAPNYGILVRETDEGG